MCTIYCSTLLFIFCDCSHKATLEVAQGVQDTLLSTNVLSIDMQAQKEVDLFIQAIEMNPAIVNLSGYGNVNRELLSSVGSALNFNKNDLLVTNELNPSRWLELLQFI